MKKFNKFIKFLRRLALIVSVIYMGSAIGALIRDDNEKWMLYITISVSCIAFERFVYNDLNL